MSSISSSPSKQVSGYKPVAGEEVAAASETGAIEVTIPGGGGDGDDRQNQTNTGELPFYNLFAGFDTIGNDPGLCALLLTGVSVILIVLTMPFSLFFCVKVVQEYERAVIFRLGRLTKGGAKGPGIFFIIPCIDTYSKVDLRTVSFDVPPQEILSKDSVTVAVDAVVYYRISNATIAVSNVEDYGRSTRLLAATTLRNVLGTKNLSEILSERESISHVMQSSLDEATDPWGVKVERVEIKDARLPVQLQRAMATEAEAAREARAKVIAAEGEQRASRALKEAAEVIHDTPAALHLRYLQTLNSIAAEKNSTIVFPLPIDIFSAFLGPNKKASKD
ncbi:band 7 protein AGAP004871-like isoform X4 [Brevipalpus obovatus]|uniref:band 7 protein AGAP004871-like isoform X4 n=1 Tax=Brevipalpus obovatus TaxID=246614 RepID=UPI003D9EFFA3